MNEIIVAANERAVRELFGAIRDNFTLAASDSASFGAFTASYAVAAHLENGTVDLRSNNTVSISELDIVWDTLAVSLGINIPTACVGGWCIVPTPWGCAVRLPRKCFFTANPDISLPINLSGFLRSEVSVVARPVVLHPVDPGRAPWMDDVDAHAAGVPTTWQVLLSIVSADVDVFDIADIVGDLLENAIDAAVDNLLSFLPSWARALVKALLGPLVALVRAILDIGDDIGEWLENLLGTSLGLIDIIITAIANHLLGDKPLVKIEDPYPVLPPAPGLIPASVPVERFDVQITDDEMVVTATVGP